MNDEIIEYLRFYIHESNATDLSIDELYKDVKDRYPHITKKVLRDFVLSDRDIVHLKGNRFISRWGILVDKPFSVVLTKTEIAQKVLIAGSRFIPFVNPDVCSSELLLSFEDDYLATKVIEVDKNTALDLFSVYGYEYAIQRIAWDPANRSDKSMELNFDQYQTVKLTAYDLTPLFDRYKIKYGDRLLCTLYSYLSNEFTVIPQICQSGEQLVLKSSDINRAKWAEEFENLLLKSFDKYGPCSSIDEQLANVYIENAYELCVCDSSSVYEVLKNSKKIGFESFGVESRLWKIGEEVPAVGSWLTDEQKAEASEALATGTFAYGNTPVCLINAHILNCLYQKTDVNVKDVQKLLPGMENADEQALKLLSLKIRDITDILKENYNLFADFKKAPLRLRALELYTKVEDLINQLDDVTTDVEKLPQQEVVILSQLMMHCFNLLELLTSDDQYEDEEYNTMSVSIDGMEYSFEEIKPILISSVEKQKKDGFEII